uniref:Uncharacterized protein n=1 Tax=Knipowitschia caucasica TaxID=637954 RepID=A0AAV2M009_KNICA
MPGQEKVGGVVAGGREEVDHRSSHIVEGVGQEVVKEQVEEYDKDGYAGVSPCGTYSLDWQGEHQTRPEGIVGQGEAMFKCRAWVRPNLDLKSCHVFSFWTITA